MISKQTTLDLNGPILSFVQQPQSVTISCEDVLLGTVATFIGIATATFPEQTPENLATNTGILSYRWYDDSGPLFDDPPPSGGDGVSIVGAASTTLKLYNNLRSRKIFLRVEYIPSAYSQPEGSLVEVGTARSTGNAVNEPINSNIVNLDLKPTIILTSEPLDQTVAETRDALFSTSAFSSDGSDVSYQWQFNELNLSDTTNQNTSITPTTINLTITDNLGQSTTVNFSQISSYSNFIAGRTYTIVSNSDIETTITASGAGGGSSIERSVAGGKGGLSSGKFKFIANQQYKLIVGGKGVDGGAGGFGGGGTGGGGTGKGGGGGGYTGLFINSVTQANSIIIAGGGGGGANDPATGGAGGGLSGSSGGNAPGRGGTGASQTSGGSGAQSGSALQGGAGAGGGGGGYFGGGSGNPYNGCCADGAGGGGSGYIHPTLLTNATTSADAGSSGDGTFKIDLVSATKQVNVTASGTRTSNLTIRTDTVGLNQVKCIISHPTACNSPIITRSANFSVVSARAVLNYEYTTDTATSVQGSGSFDLKDGRATFSYSSSLVERVPVHPNFGIITIYPPERDVNVRITLAGAAGGPGFIIVNNALVTVPGGQGGVTVFDLTLKKNIEYVIRTGIRMGLGNSPQGGYPNGGGGSYFYRQSQTLVISGGGGGSTNFVGRGGAGGGALNGGENGTGSSSTAGGSYVSPGTLGTNGSFARDITLAFNVSASTFATSFNFGGKASSCVPGSGYWAQQGISQCSNMGLIQAVNLSGSIISNTTNTIGRGHKYGLGFRNNGGNGYPFQNDNRRTGGGGGDGAYGGNGGAVSSTTFDGGGGGSGYTNGEATIISSTLGGNSSEWGYARIELR